MKRKKGAGNEGLNENGKGGELLLPFAFDSGYIYGAHPPDSDDDADMDGFSDSEENGWAHLAMSLSMFSGFLLSSGLVDMEMMRSREAAFQAEADSRCAEAEAQLKDMMLRTQLQIATFLGENCPRWKRKRSQFREQQCFTLSSSSPRSSPSSNPVNDADETENKTRVGREERGKKKSHRCRPICTCPCKLRSLGKKKL